MVNSSLKLKFQNWEVIFILEAGGLFLSIHGLGKRLDIMNLDEGGLQCSVNRLTS